jgi:DNA-binding XRE family transcriptional regulator
MSDRDEWLGAFPGIVQGEREKSALTQEELAGHLGLDVEAVDSWEQGYELPTLPQFFDLAELFGWPIPRLIVKEGLTGH